MNKKNQEYSICKVNNPYLQKVQVNCSSSEDSFMTDKYNC